MSVSEITSLPRRANLEHLKKQAKDLLNLARAGDPVALARFAEVARRRDAQAPRPTTATLADAQHLIARSYGFAAWLELVLEVRRLRALRLGAEGLPNEPEKRLDLLFEAIDDNDVEAVRALLTLDASLAHGAGDRNPLRQAAGLDHAKMLDLLLAAGASFHDASGAPHDPLSWAITTRAFGAAEHLAERGAPLDLWCAAGLGDVVRVAPFFDEQGRVLPNASRYGATRFDVDGKILPKPPTDPVEVISDALYIAARNGQLEVARFLLDRGADPSFEGYVGAPALHWAAFSGNRELVQLLRDRGADPAQRDRRLNVTYRQFAVRVPIEWEWLGALERALSGDASLVHERGDQWGPALHAAAAQGLDEHVHALLAAGADVHALDHAGRTALEAASQTENSPARARILAMLESAA